MNGIEFYNHLQKELKPNQSLGEKFTFKKWLIKKDNTYSLQFNIPNNNQKAIPCSIIIQAKNKYNKERKVVITESWFKENNCNRGWCVPQVMNWLLKNYD
jgi:hypothetical protein